MKISISDFTIESILAGDYRVTIPELYELRDVIENSRNFHKNDSVFDHSIRVTKNLIQLLDSSSDAKTLYLASIFHDLGKKESIVYSNGYSSCPGHEEQGCMKVEKILSRFDISTRERERVSQLILNHQVIFDILSSKNSNLEEEIRLVMKKFSEFMPDLILFTIADIQGSQLKETQPEEYKFRIQFLETLLKNYENNHRIKKSS